MHLSLTYGILVNSPIFHPIQILDGINLEKVFAEEYYTSVAIVDLNTPTCFKDNKTWIEYINDRETVFRGKIKSILDYNAQYIDIETLKKIKLLESSDFIRSMTLNLKFIEKKGIQNKFYINEKRLCFLKKYIDDCITIITNLNETKNK